MATTLILLKDGDLTLLFAIFITITTFSMRLQANVMILILWTWWGTNQPRVGLNGTGSDNYEEGLFKKHIVNVIKNHDPPTPLFLYYATHAPHDPYEVPDAYMYIEISLY